MKVRPALFSLSLLLCVALLAVLPASGQQTLYENGPINGTQDAWTINFGFEIGNTFTISGGSSTITGMSFGAWLMPGDTLVSVEVSLTSDALGGTTYFDQNVNFTTSNCFVNNYGYNVCQETGSFNGPTLNNGTYWMNLQNAVDTAGDPVYWDENSGIGCHSQGCPSEADNGSIGTLPSEAFSILGSTSTGPGSTPEPSSLLLFGSGVMGAIGLLRRKLL